MKYSEGEWQIKEVNLGCKEIVVRGERIFSLDLGFTHGLNDEEEDLGNACLIAGAKDTYKALKEIIEECPNPKLPYGKKVVEIAKEAIAKVERKAI